MKFFLRYILIIFSLSILLINTSKAEDILSKKIVNFDEILESPDNLQLNL